MSMRHHTPTRWSDSHGDIRARWLAVLCCWPLLFGGLMVGGNALATAIVGGGRAPSDRLQAVTHPHPGWNDQVRVYGCPSEDSCRVDYRRETGGEPVWVIRQVTP